MCFAAIGMALGATAGSAAVATGLSAVGTAFSIGSTLMDYRADQKQFAAEQQQYNTNRLLAQQSMLEQAGQLSLRESQERDALLDKAMANKIEAAKAKGRTIASAGEAGVSGLSIAALVADIERTKLNNQGTINRNFDAIQQQGIYDRKALESQAQGRVNNMALPTAPSLLGTGLQIAGLGLQGYNKYNKINNPNEPAFQG
tara:strand:+ start:315 stop:917 length:603 start_codon:yes stop_codon:yes gene_type:complete